MGFDWRGGYTVLNDATRACSKLTLYVLRFLQKDEDLAQSIRQVRFLVLDEADRMIETGHFKELEQIVKLTFREREGYISSSTILLRGLLTSTLFN